jgi:nucleoid-associated protein YgaU
MEEAAMSVTATSVLVTEVPTVTFRTHGGEPTLRLTRRGRAVVAILAMLGATYVTFASQQAVAGSGADAVPVATRTVVAGETLWEIAGEYAEPGQDVREVVDELMDLNGLTGGRLRAGQELLGPAP